MSGYQDDSILNSLMDALVDRLQEKLVGETYDVTKAGLVRAGKLQADPTDNLINILVHEGGEEWFDELRVEQDGFGALPYEIGGVEWWMRRFVIELTLFFDNENEREVARDKAMIIYSRARKATYGTEIPTDADGFGEQAHMLQIRKGWIREGGGEGTFIWEGKLFVEFLTSIRRNA